MSVTQQELNHFHAFAQARLAQPQPPVSLQECLDQWRRERDEAEVVADLELAIAEADTGAGIEIQVAASQLRQEVGWYGQRT